MFETDAVKDMRSVVARVVVYWVAFERRNTVNLEEASGLVQPANPARSTYEPSKA